jgi:hypothetical protein
MADEPRLNSLARFRKQPVRLVLEEHGHCEVPAGCGGVVLRWRNPLAAVNVTLYLYTPVEAECRLDGATFQTSHIDLSPGRHVLTVALPEVDLAGPLLMFVAAHEPKKYQQVRPAAVAERPFKVVSLADGTWKFSTQPPPEAWDAADFDDRAWSALAFVPTPRLGWGDHGAWQCHECTRQGAVCLGHAGTAPNGRVWVRKVFEVPGPDDVSPPRPE